MRLNRRPGSKPRKELRLRPEEDVLVDLGLYADLYRETYGDPIEPKDLAAEILKQFLDSDKELRAYKKRASSADRLNGGIPSAEGDVRA